MWSASVARLRAQGSEKKTGSLLGGNAPWANSCGCNTGD